MRQTLINLIRKLEICREGKCYACEYFKEYCTDDLIDDVYTFLLKELEDEEK